MTTNYFRNYNNIIYLKRMLGRVKLSECDDKKAVTGHKDKNEELTFELIEGNVIVTYVPGVYGVRVGSEVQGFIQSDSTTINEIRWPPNSDRKQKKSCSLKQLMEYNGIKKKTDTLVFKTPCIYCTKFLKVDTKEFGLPQTRNRGYLFVWRPDENNVYDNLVR